MMLPPSALCADDREDRHSTQTVCSTSAEKTLKPSPISSLALTKQVRGFSLVEVVFAMGLCTFALLSLLSLVPISLDSAKKAMEITRIAKAFQMVTAELIQSKFANIATMTTNEWYFDYEGNAVNAADKFFTVRATIASSPITNQTSASLLRVKLESQTLKDPHAGSTTITVCDMGY